MDLSFLIPSKMRRLVLEYFVENPDAQIHVNQLARELKSAPQLVYRELINLENWGFLFSSKLGNQRVYRLNKRFVFFKPIADIFTTRRRILSQPPRSDKVLDWKKLKAKYDKIPVPEDLDKRLRAKKTTPRAYEEERMLKNKGLL